MRKLASVVAVLGAVGLFGLIAGSAAAPFPKPTKQQIAQRILDHAILTGPAHAFFAAQARGDQRLTSDPPGSKIQGRGTANGNKPPGGGLTNVRVNDPGEDTHQTEQTTQSETSIAVSGTNVAVGFNDSQTTLLFLTPASDLSGYAYSHDGGATFTDGGALPNNTPTINFGDPWLASSNGTMYYSNLVDDPFVGLLVGVATSPDGQTWAAPTELPIPPQAPNASFGGADKDALTASASNLYDSWDDFSFTFDPNTGRFLVQSGLTMAHSPNGGQSWQSVYADQVTVFDSNNPCAFHQYIGAQPLVGSDGTVYDFALRFDQNDPVAGDPPPACANVQPLTESEVVAVSHDGGGTFSKPVVIANVASSTGAPFGDFQLGPGQFMRNLEFPTVAQAGGNVYVAWNDGASGQSHIMFSKSADGGASWSTPSAVTSGSNNEAQPAISADASGLHILYYEISSSGTGTSQLDTVVANSKNNGHSWSMTRVTSQSFPGVYTLPQFDPIIAFAYMGDYIANVSDGTHQYFAWGDNRDVVTSFLWPRGRNDPDVFFARQ